MPMKRAHVLVILLLVYVAWIALYEAVSAVASGGVMHTLSIPLDQVIPFMPQWEYLYLLCYLMPLTFVALPLERELFRAFLWAFAAVNLFCFAFFILYPVYYPRPAVTADSLAARLLLLEYAADKPVNNFPSLHVAISWLMAFAYWNHRKRAALALMALASGISVSTLFVKQHYVFDVLAGFALACAAALLAVLVSRAAERKRFTAGEDRTPSPAGTLQP